MSYSRENYIRVRREFDMKYIKSRDEAMKRRDELHSRFPELRSIDDALAETGMRVFRETMAGKEGLDERLAVIRSETEELKAIRSQWLVYHGYPADYTDIKYECDLCHDTGSVGLSMCVCMKRALTLAGYESSGIGNLIKTQSFETFDISYYSDDKEAFENIKLVLAKCRSYADSFSADSPNLLFRGDTGLGKTHLSTSIAKTVIERGFDVVYDTAQNIFSCFESERFGRSENASDKNTSRFFECDLLIFDDLGAEMSNQFTVSCLYNIINTRINCNRPMIINTNLKIDELRRRYSDRITSRLFGEFQPLQFMGTDIRAKKLR
jgi:DNA replication protein DnaC